jgi:hypothetical protein
MKTLSFNKFFVVLLFFSFSLVSVQAQKGDPNADRNDSHFLTVSLSGGVSNYSLMSVSDSLQVNSLPFLGGGLGVGYEWHHTSGFWLGFGLEGELLTSKLKNTQDIYQIDAVVDSELDTSDIAYNIVTWKEMQRVLSVNVPIMLGYKLESGFYFGAGVKVGLSLYADVMSDFQFSDCVVFYQKYPPMPIKESLDANNVTSSEKGFVGRVNLSPMLELGWQGLDIKGADRYSGGVRFKFALCGEYGVLSAYGNSGGEGNLLNYSNLHGYDDLMKVMDLIDGINSFFSTMPMGKGGMSLHSWYVGVKVGVMFEMPKRKGCNCLGNNVIKPWIKGRKDRGVE